MLIGDPSSVPKAASFFTPAIKITMNHVDQPSVTSICAFPQEAEALGRRQVRSRKLPRVTDDYADDSGKDADVDNPTAIDVQHCDCWYIPSTKGPSLQPSGPRHYGIIAVEGEDPTFCVVWGQNRSRIWCRLLRLGETDPVLHDEHSIWDYNNPWKNLKPDSPCHLDEVYAALPAGSLHERAGERHTVTWVPGPLATFTREVDIEATISRVSVLGQPLLQLDIDILGLMYRRR
jgi:hypothetical protein